MGGGGGTNHSFKVSQDPKPLANWASQKNSDH